MFDNYKDDINTKRETNKIGLETFALDRYNILDRPIDKLIKELKKDLEHEYSEHQKWVDLETYDPEKFEELEEKAQQSGHSLYFQRDNYIRDVMYIEEELTTLYEMKIIYAFKHLEIDIKNLISASFGDKSIGKSSKWDNLIQYLKSKKININQVENYNEVNQLRTVNNSLKHSHEQIDSSLKGIDEFKHIEPIHYEILEKFYTRVKYCSNSFLSSLSSAIYENLYEFDDEKLERISKSIVLRMDKKNADKLIDRIKNNYE